MGWHCTLIGGLKQKRPQALLPIEALHLGIGTARIGDEFLFVCEEMVHVLV